jgi:chemotaxis protein histidine kinase CheA
MKGIESIESDIAAVARISAVGGSVQVTSTEETGTTFTAGLPRFRN